MNTKKTEITLLLDEKLLQRTHETNLDLSEFLEQKLTEYYDIYPLYGKPRKEIHRLKIFMDVFNSLHGPDRADVPEDVLINEVAETGFFHKLEVRSFIKQAMQNGQIYETRTGFYARA